jgi:hypothetical protein
MKSRVWLLPLVMGGALAAVYVLPKAGSTEESAVRMRLPDFSNGWEFQKLAASADEIQTLSGDTEFSKAICFRPRPGEVNLYGNPVNERVDLSVVLSGHDLNNSIHRPERCMPAQGHRITGSGNVVLPMENGRSFKAKRLRSVQAVKDPATGKVVAELSCLTYYFFVGHDEITNDHLERTFIDMKDRLLRGMDQRWAYVSASMWFGDLPWSQEPVSEEEADGKLKKFVTEFSVNQIDWTQIQP